MIKKTLLSIVLALSLSVVTAVLVIAGPIKNIDITLADDRAGATTDYEISFTPKTGEATAVSIDFSAFGTTGTDMILSAVSTNIGDYSFTGFSVNPTGVVVNDTTKIITFTGGTTTKDTEHTIINSIPGIGLVITNDQDAETKKIRFSTASDSGDSWLAINPGAIDHYSVSNVSSPQVASTPIAVTIQAQDQFDNDISDGADAVENITISFGKVDTGATPTSTVTNNGKVTVDITMTVAQTGQSITFTGDTSGKVGTSNSFDVNPSALSSFTISGTPTTILVDTAFPSPAHDITVTAFDGLGNIKTDYVGTITWSSPAIATLPPDYTFVLGDAGAKTFLGNQFIIHTIGTQTLTVTDVIASISATSVVFVVVPWIDHSPPPDTTSPIISQIAASNITETSADISWKTNEASTSQVEYGARLSHISPIDETLRYNHLVHLTDLTPGTTYYYKTISRDSAGNLAVSDVYTFTTLGEAPAAAFSTSNLSISPSEVNIGETVTISIVVANTGSLTGSYEVTLKINDIVEAYKDMTVDAGTSKEVTFTTVKDLPGSYSVAVDGLSGSFDVLAPAAFSVLDLYVQPTEAMPGEVVTIALLLTNTGGIEGSYDLSLNINGIQEKTQNVTVDAGTSKEVTFTTLKDLPGSYSVAVDGLSGSFNVLAPAPKSSNWQLIVGITVAVVIVSSASYFFALRRRKA